MVVYPSRLGMRANLLTRYITNPFAQKSSCAAAINIEIRLSQVAVSCKTQQNSPMIDEQNPRTDMPSDDENRPDNEDSMPDTGALDALFVDQVGKQEEPVYSGDNLKTPMLDGFDIDAALAAVATLPDLLDNDEADDSGDIAEGLAVAEPEITPVDEDRYTPESDEETETGISPVITDETDETDETTESRIPEPETAPQAMTVPTMPEITSPALSRLHRGQAASVIPALLLIAGGIGLGALVLSGESLAISTIAGVSITGAGLMLVAQWLSADRTTAGNFFIGMLLLLTGGVFLYLLQPDSPGATGFPLFIVAGGVTVTLTALVTASARVLLPIGLALIVAGLVSIPVMAGMMDTGLMKTLETVLPGVLVLLVIMLLLPLVRRRT